MERKHRPHKRPHRDEDHVASHPERKVNQYHRGREDYVAPHPERKVAKYHRRKEDMQTALLTLTDDTNTVLGKKTTTPPRKRNINQPTGKEVAVDTTPVNQEEHTAPIPKERVLITHTRIKNGVPIPTVIYQIQEEDNP